MRTTTIAVAAVLATAALSANAAAPRMESNIGPFTYEVLGATPTLTFGRARAAAPQAVAAPKPATATAASSGSASRQAGSAITPLTYDALGATPHVELKKPARTDVEAPQTAR